MKNKPTIYRIHFNKHEKCWSVHNRNKCYLVEHIDFVCYNKDCIRTEEQPNRKTNPRFFIRVFGLEHKISFGRMTIYG